MIENYGKIISKNLKRIMYENQLTQAEVAKTLGINKATLSSWMNGTRIPRMEKVVYAGRSYDQRSGRRT